MDPLSKARIGRTSLRVTRMGLGGGAIGGLFETVPEERAVATVRRARSLGINFFDTAPLYGHGKSEMYMGKGLAGTDPASRVLATKVGRVLVPADPSTQRQEDGYINPAPYEPVFDFSFDGVMRSFEDSKRRLNLDRVDILHIHDADDHYDEAMKGAYPALDKLRSEGQIQAVGAGMNQWEMLARFARAGDFDCFLLAGRYTLIDHTALAEFLPLCVKKQISIVIGGPYNSGVLASGARPGAKFNYAEAPPQVLEKVRKLQHLCERHHVPMKAAALQFPLAHPAVAAVIPGARSVEEVEESFRFMSHPIPAEFWSELRAQGLIPEDAPVPTD